MREKSFGRNRRKASLKDIATELGVSLSLVSKVLNGRLGTTKVRPELEKSILKRASALRFRPNSLARSLQSGRTGTIGLIIHPVGVQGSELFQDFLRGLSSELEARQQRLWLRFFRDRGDFLSEWELHSTREVDGLIVAGVRHHELNDYLHRWQMDKLPIVTAFNVDTDLVAGIPNVAVNHERQAYLAVEHLIQQGSRRVVLANYFPSRFKGYRRALRDNGVRFSKQLIYDIKHDDFGASSGAFVVKSMREAGVEFDGIVAQSDAMAHGAINALREAGIKVPQDVKVVGIDNSPICEICSPTLSSTSSEMLAIGKAAAEILFQQIDGRKVRSKVIQPVLQVRGSTGR